MRKIACLLVGALVSVPGASRCRGQESVHLVWKPAVKLSAEHERACLVKVGDTFPVVQLADVDGQLIDISQQYGKQLTVIVLWSSRTAGSRQLIANFDRDILRPFASDGVAGVAINRHDTPPVVRALTTGAQDKFVNLLDSDDVLWQKLATDLMPRVFLVDGQGTVLWLDVEYSLGTRRELRNAIRYYLENGQGKKEIAG